ncbi:MAG: hypothetical protein FJY55_14765, partial [Betaproteobacteria bacterium]|nr:hypothetical protein [Betaproteobacteria bacterium]
MLVLQVLLSALLVQQPTPQPFPRPGGGAPPRPADPAAPAAPQAPATVAAEAIPTEATLGVALYPEAQYLTSYDAGRGQRYYLFGTTGSFVAVVTYYRTVLKQRGELVFEAPATHQFDIGRFREETMAFPPSVTVKDYQS